MLRFTERRVAPAVAAVAVLLAAPAAAPAGMIYNNFGPDFGIGFGGLAIANDPDGIFQSVAQAFHTPGESAFELERVYLPLFLEDNVTTFPVTVSLYTSAPGALGGPDALVAVLTDRTYLTPPDDPFATPLFSYAAAGPVTLAPDTEYWVVAEVPPIPGSFFQNIWLDAPTFIPNRNAARLSLDGPWLVNNDQEDPGYSPSAMRVDAEAVVPAPPGAVLLAAGAGCLGLARRRRHRRRDV
jgi:hypothetical protein